MDLGKLQALLEQEKYTGSLYLYFVRGKLDEARKLPKGRSSAIKPLELDEAYRTRKPDPYTL